MPRLRPLCALVAASVGCLLVGTFAPAVTPAPADPSSTTTTATTAPSTTTSTAAGSTSTETESSTTTGPPTATTKPPPLGGITQVTPPPSTTTSTGPGGVTTSPDETTTTTVVVGDNGVNVPRGVIPADAQGVIDSYQRSPGNSTAKLLAALQPLIDLGVPQDQAYAIGMGHFPVAGLANFADDWLFPR